MPKLLARAVAALLLSLPLVTPPLPAAAQVPPHTPGAICFVPQDGVWCWASPPGIPGDPCFCAGYGNPGVLG